MLKDILLIFSGDTKWAFLCLSHRLTASFPNHLSTFLSLLLTMTNGTPPVILLTNTTEHHFFLLWISQKPTIFSLIPSLYILSYQVCCMIDFRGNAYVWHIKYMVWYIKSDLCHIGTDLGFLLFLHDEHEP